jgi:hypothetical protein
VKQSLLLAAFATTLAALPAQAQPFAADLLPAYEVNTIVASMGMRPLGRPAWMRGRYVVAAIDRYGRDVNVVIDARDGQVLAVRPLGRGRFGPPSPGYGPRPGPYDRMDGRGAPPPMGPGGLPPADEDEFFDNDQQQGSLRPPRPTARIAPPPRDPAVTGSVTRSTPAVRRDLAPKDATPVPRPRPALARANDPGNKPAASSSQPVPVNPAAAKTDDAKPDGAKPAAVEKPGQAEAKAEVTPAVTKPEAGKPAASKPAASKPAATPAAAKPEVTAKSAAPKPEVRVIDLSKPKTAPKPESKPGEAIRF